MGHGKWSSESYTSYSTTKRGVSRSNLFGRKSKDDAVIGGQAVNIEEIKFRESRDSEEHPVTTPVIVGLDVTGSMGMIPEELVKNGLGIFVDNLLQSKQIPGPHILFAGIGDAVAHDQAPLQVTQFEADNSICDQLTDIWLEGRGGGNNFESYDLAWAFAAYKTQTDAWEKRQEKGFLFTVGDEMFPWSTDTKYFNSVIGSDVMSNPTPEKLLEKALERWHVYHIIIEEGSYVRNYSLDKVKNSWQQHLYKRAITLSDYKYLPQVMTTAISLESGKSLDEILDGCSDVERSVLENSFS